MICDYISEGRQAGRQSPKPMTREYYSECIICYDTPKDPVGCKQCIYSMCKRCIVDSGSLEMKICKHKPCRYGYLHNTDHPKRYLCDTGTNSLLFCCPACSIRRQVSLCVLEDEIAALALQQGPVRLTSTVSALQSFALVYYTILDLDTGKCVLSKFRTGPC